MITQRQLSAVLRARAHAAKLALDPAVLAHQAAETAVAEALAAIRTRFEAGEEVEAGKLRAVRSVKSSTSVAWEKLFKHLKGVPAVARLLAKDKTTADTLALAEGRSAASPYVRSSSSVCFDVVPAE